MTVITVEWDNEDHNILLITLRSGEWTIQDMLDMLAQARELVETISHPYATIVNMCSSDYLPPNLLANFPKIIDASGSYPNDTGTIIAMPTRGMNKIPSDIFSQVIRKLTIVYSIEEAYRLAHERL